MLDHINPINNYFRLLSNKLNVPVIGVIPYATFEDNTFGDKIYASPQSKKGPQYRIFYPNGKVISF